VASKPKPRRRGFDEGGQISSSSLGDSISKGFGGVTSAYAAYKRGKYYDELTDQAKAKLGAPGPPSGAGYTPPPPDQQTGGLARGGKIKRTSGPRIGKDDGLIPAQKGEFVVRKSAVNRLGTKALNTINKGRLPQKKGR
jgi:hypothetical protein